MESNTDPRSALSDIVSALGGLLAFEKDEGASHIDIAPRTVQALGDGPGAATPTPARTIPMQRKEPDASDSHTDVRHALDAIAKRIADCRQCPLCEGRTKTVPGQGAWRPQIAFVGEGPGADEDRQGLAFVGRAGQLLTKIIEAMGLTRDDVWIGNIVKCRPPGNRVPYPDEMEACMPYLKEQLAILRPSVIVCLGATAVKGLLDTGEGITKIRGRWMTFEGIDVMPTFHPAYLLRNAAGKKDVWRDMKEVLRFLGREPPPKTP